MTEEKAETVTKPAPEPHMTRSNAIGWMLLGVTLSTVVTVFGIGSLAQELDDAIYARRNLSYVMYGRGCVETKMGAVGFVTEVDLDLNFRTQFEDGIVQELKLSEFRKIECDGRTAF